MRFGIFVLGGVAVRNEDDRVAPRRLAWRGGSRHRRWRAHQLRETVPDGTLMIDNSLVVLGSISSTRCGKPGVTLETL